MTCFRGSITLFLATVCALGYAAASDSITIGAFNIQKFGPTKADKEDVMAHIVKIVIQYDIIMVQEVVDASGEAIEVLMDSLNEQTGFVDKFTLQISPRVGSGSYKEQYAFIYRNDRVSVKKSEMYPDRSDIIAREPYLVQFNSRQNNALEFTIAGAHISPDEVKKELDEMDNVYDYIMENFDTKSVLLMGDFNADCGYLSNKAFKSLDLNTRSEFTWPLPEDADTTVATSDCQYDRFVSAGAFADAIVSGSAEVHKFDEELGLSQEEALKVSDHYPIRLKIA